MRPKRSSVPSSSLAPKTYKIVRGFLEGLGNLEYEIKVEELIAIPSTSATYASHNLDRPKKIGNAQVFYVGLNPVFESKSNTPIAYDLNFHTMGMGIVPILRISQLDILDDVTINQINGLKLKANQAIARKLGQNDILIRYQWYYCLLEALGVSLEADKRCAATVIDDAAEQQGVNVASGFGFLADDSTVALKIMDHFGFSFKSPRKLPPTYPSLNAYPVSLLEHGGKYEVIVGSDLEQFLTGSKSNVLAEFNKANSNFRIMFANSAQNAAELFMKQLNLLPNKTSIEIGVEEEAITTQLPLPEDVELEHSNTNFETKISASTTPLERTSEFEKHGYKLLTNNKSGKFELLKFVATVTSEREAWNLISVDEQKEASTLFGSRFGSRQNFGSRVHPQQQKLNIESLKPRLNQSRSIEDTYNEPIYPNEILIKQDENGYFVNLGSELLVEHEIYEGVIDNLTKLLKQDSTLIGIPIYFVSNTGKKREIFIQNGIKKSDAVGGIRKSYHPADVAP